MKYAPHGVVFTLHRAGGISPRTLSLQDKRDKFIWVADYPKNCSFEIIKYFPSLPEPTYQG
jgi:hypothetical protein